MFLVYRNGKFMHFMIKLTLEFRQLLVIVIVQIL